MNRQKLSQLDFSALISFLEVAERGSFTEAAIALNLSQPTVSQQVQKVERFLGVQLLYRKPHGVSLTKEGRVFIHHCRTCLQAIEDGAKDVAQLSQTITGKVVLGLTPSASQRCLSDVLSHYCRQYPQVKVKVLEEHPDELVKKLKQGAVDLAVLSLPISSDHVTIEVLYEEPLTLIVAATHPLAITRQIAWQDLTQLPLILHKQDVDFGIRSIVEQLYSHHHCQLQAVAEVSGYQSLKQLVLANFGAAFLPLSLVRTDIENGNFVAVQLPEGDLLHVVAIAHYQQYQPNLATEKLAEVIRIHALEITSAKPAFDERACK